MSVTFFVTFCHVGMYWVIYRAKSPQQLFSFLVQHIISLCQLSQFLEKIFLNFLILRHFGNSHATFILFAGCSLKQKWNLVLVSYEEANRSKDMSVRSDINCRENSWFMMSEHVCSRHVSLMCWVSIAGDPDVDRNIFSSESNSRSSRPWSLSSRSVCHTFQYHHFITNYDVILKSQITSLWRHISRI